LDSATRSRPTCCWWRSGAAQHRRPRLRGGRTGPRGGFRQHRRTPSHQPRRRLRRRRHRRRLAAGPPRISAWHLCGRRHRRPSPPTGRRGRHPKVTYCQPEVASVGLTEAARETEVRGDRNAHIPISRQRQVTDLADPGAIKLIKARRQTARPVSGRRIHMVGARVVSSSRGPACLQLAGRGGTSPRWCTPTPPERAFGEAPPCPAGKPLHAHGVARACAVYVALCVRTAIADPCIAAVASTSDHRSPRQKCID